MSLIFGTVTREQMFNTMGYVLPHTYTMGYVLPHTYTMGYVEPHTYTMGYVLPTARNMCPWWTVTALARSDCLA